jgi:hypothetical protein
MVNKYTLSITLGYIVLWNVIRRIYLTVRNTFDEPWRGPPPLFLNLLENMESIEVGWPAIIDIFGTTRYSLYICKYNDLQNMLVGSWDI